MGTIKLKEVLSIIMTIIELKGITNIPPILIIGDKKLSEINLMKLFKNALASEKIFYLSAPDGVDIATYRKASIENAQAVYFITNFMVSGSSDALT
jgi:hypothetical protein